MPKCYWGDNRILVEHGSFILEGRSREINEIHLLPSYGGSSPDTSLQSGPTIRAKVHFNTLFKTLSDYNALLQDHITQTARTFTAYDGLEMEMTVSHIGEVAYKNGLWLSSIELIEVEEEGDTDG